MLLHVQPLVGQRVGQLRRQVCLLLVVVVLAGLEVVGREGAELGVGVGMLAVAAAAAAALMVLLAAGWPQRGKGAGPAAAGPVRLRAPVRH